MSFNDIFKSGFLENVTSVSLLDMTIALVLAFCLGVFIFWVYKKTFSGVMYSSGFGVTLIALTMITTLVILAVTSNVVLSLGMVGALSIVRFRTAVKEPMDLVFLFWSISVGIICGAGLAVIAFAVTAILSVLLWVFNALPVAKAPVLLLVSAGDYEKEAPIMEAVGKFCRASSVKSRNLNAGQLDLVVEVRTPDEPGLAAAVMGIEGVTSVSLVAHDGEVTF